MHVLKHLRCKLKSILKGMTYFLLLYEFNIFHLFQKNYARKKCRMTKKAHSNPPYLSCFKCPHCINKSLRREKYTFSLDLRLFWYCYVLLQGVKKWLWKHIFVSQYIFFFQILKYFYCKTRKLRNSVTFFIVYTNHLYIWKHENFCKCSQRNRQ